MHKISKNTAKHVEAEMYTHYENRGSMTEIDLIRAGFTQEEIATYAPKVAERIRLVEAA